ncbi:MAG: sodium-dependent transporter [candidate division Zixibacteria bacterium]|jgi:SNF family Na+-dependent transporter|nr:sodium-dependent transporter [candidate division Zixibacteria bacterium]
MTKTRERWGSRLGIILAVAGSAVGLGNFLRFPSEAAQNGGGAFMIPYFVALVLIGVPLMWAEWTAGRFGGGFGHSSAPGIFHSMYRKNRFVKYFGVMGIFGPFVIYMFYVYLESWCLAFAYYSLAGKLHFSSPDGYIQFLQWYQGVSDSGFFSGSVPGIVFFLITLVLNLAVTYSGIRGGVERLCNIALPALFIMAVVLAIRVLTLDAPVGAADGRDSIGGLGFLWNPDLSALGKPSVWLAAAGQVFFTLSVGMGVILTYSSYLTRNDDIALSGLTAATTNEFAEVVLGGSIVIPAAFVFFGQDFLMNANNLGSFDLGFLAMPQIFAGIPGGAFWGFLWFFILFLAGITSSISVAQPTVAFLEDEFNLSRQKAVRIFGVAAFVLCQPAVWFLHRGVLDELNFWGGTFIIVIGALFELILLAWVFGIDKAWDELHCGCRMRVPRIFRYIIKYVSPTLLIAMLIWWLATDWWAVITMDGVPDQNVPYVLGIRLILLALIATIAVLVWVAWRRRPEGDRTTQKGANI